MSRNSYKPLAIFPFSSLYLKYPFYIYIVIIVLLELRLYRRGGSITESYRKVVLVYLDYTGRLDKSGLIALNQFRPSVPVWSETLWPTFVKHVGIST